MFEIPNNDSMGFLVHLTGVDQTFSTAANEICVFYSALASDSVATMRSANVNKIVLLLNVLTFRDLLKKWCRG